MTSILGTPTLVDNGAYNAAYTAETGAEGVVILMAHEQTGTGRYMASGTLGGQALTNILQLQQQADGSSTWIVIEAWCLKAAGIAAMSGNTIAMTAHASGNSNWKGIAYSLNDWDQTTPLVTTSTDGDFSLTDLSVSVSAASGTIVLGIWAGSNGSYGTASGKALTDAGFTHDRVPTNTGTGYAIHTGYRVGIGSQTGAGSTITATLDSGDPGDQSAQAAALLVFPTASAGPTISSLSDATPNYLGSLTITGTGFPTSQSGSAAVTIGGVSQTVTWNTSTSCGIGSIARGSLKYGVSVNVVVTDASGNSSTGYATTLSPQAGWSYVNLSGTLASEGERLTAVADLASGDQVAHGNVQGTGTVTVNADASYSYSAGVTAFDWEVNDGVWSTTGTITIGPDASNRGLVRNLTRSLVSDLTRNLVG